MYRSYTEFEIAVLPQPSVLHWNNIKDKNLIYNTVLYKHQCPTQSETLWASGVGELVKGDGGDSIQFNPVQFKFIKLVPNYNKSYLK